MLKLRTLQTKHLDDDPKLERAETVVRQHDHAVRDTASMDCCLGDWHKVYDKRRLGHWQQSLRLTDTWSYQASVLILIAMRGRARRRARPA